MSSNPEERDDLERLVRDAQAGDRAARDRLVAENVPGLRAYVRLKMNPALRANESCCDVVQSVCREVVEKLDKFEYRGAASFRNWLFRSALNKIIDKQRYWLAERRDRGREVALDAARRGSPELLDAYATITSPSRAAIGNEDLARIEAAFDRLPDHYREVVVLSRLVGLSHQEIAEQLGKTADGTRTILRRALVMLSGLLDEGSEPA